MARSHITPNSSTNKTIDAIDRKRERERRYLLLKARDNAPELAALIVQRLIDEKIIETNSDRAIREAVEKQLKKMIDIEEFEMLYKIAPIRSVTQDPNIVSLYLTQFVIEDLINHPNILDIYGEDLDVYKAIDSVLGRIRPQ
jgi:ribosome-associated translation inhibitor RaiA